MRARAVIAIAARRLLVAAAMIIMKYLATAVGTKLVLAGIASLLVTTIIARATGIYI